MVDHPTQGAFIWPPKAPPAPGPTAQGPSAPIAPDGPPPQPAATPWQDIEETWLGLESHPLSRRLTSAGIVPDRADAYCWRCAHTIGPFASDQAGCPRCRAMKLPWQGAVRLGPYKGLWRRAVLDVKFARFARLGEQLGALLARPLAQRLQDAGVDPASIALVPVPTSLRRRLVRGIDHPLALARGIHAAWPSSANSPRPPVWRALTKRHRPAQAQLPKTERLTNLAGAIGPAWALRTPAWPVLGSPARLLLPRPVRRALDGRAGRTQPLTLVLIDDVTTTGATLLAAARACTLATRRLLGPDRPPPGLWIAVVGATEEGKR